MTSNSSSTPKTRSEPQIQKLKDEVIDQIAAGEVVERPSHMVKELCENSLDAGATELTVDISRGGRNVIVKDNGRGLNPSELPLALARHATSKITEANDLWQIGSYGFRGEALASIGAVSRIKIISRTHEAQEGAQIECEFGRIGTVTAVGAEPGTTVQVDELYENVPARLKFLKSEAGEVTAIKLQLKALALANPQVDIRVLQDGELTFYWPATNTKHKRVEQILELQDLYNGEGEAEGVRAHVVVASPNQTAKNSRQIWLFVRGRYVQDRSLQTAVLEAYRNLLMHGEYPYAAVYIDCDPQNVDVNVSPTKSQVKFKDAGQVFRAVHRAVRGVLEKAPWVEPMLASRVGPAPTQFKNQQQPSETLSFSAPEMEQTFFQHKRTVSEFSLEKVKDALNSLEASTSETASKTAAPNTATLVTTTRALWSQLEVLGQSHLTYIITQNSDAILFIDQHAAHERVLFERLLKNYKDGQIDVQNLNCDFLAFSAHKMYGPYGLGVLYGKKQHLDKMQPVNGGGAMIDRVTKAKTTYHVSPYKFEPGTPNISSVVGFGAALDFIEEIGQPQIKKHETELLDRTVQLLSQIPRMQMIGASPSRVNVVSFVIEGQHASDIGHLLDQQGIAVRTGHHCNQVLMDQFGLTGTVRVSFGVHNSLEDIEVFYKAIAKVEGMLR